MYSLYDNISLKKKKITITILQNCTGFVEKNLRQGSTECDRLRISQKGSPVKNNAALLPDSRM